MKPGVYIETEEEITFIADLDEAVSADVDYAMHDILTQVRDVVIDAMASPDDDDRILIIRIVQ